jgi:hypothetical protein
MSQRLGVGPAAEQMANLVPASATALSLHTGANFHEISDGVSG